MQGFSTHSGKIAVVDIDQCDTDRIIPARFLTRVDRSGYGELLFKDVRGPDFPLDRPKAAGATVLVAGTNFGCGSSREHAVWAIQQAGFKAVVGRIDAETRGFSDIFRQNSANCGLLLIELSARDHAALTTAGSGATVQIDLPNQTISLGSETLRFDIAPGSKAAILGGLDLIGTTLVHERDIDRYEAESRAYIPEAV